MLPASIGPYTIEARLGAGGMGVVYLAEGPNGRVALKVLRAALSDAAFATRFAREGLVQVAHPNVGAVLDVGTDAEGSPYIAFEYLEGETLAEVFERGRPATSDLVDWAVQAARGLAAAHEAGVVHRDVKPSNVFLCDDGTIKIIDFGIALADDDRTRLTRTGAVPGTVGYLAPEQAEGHGDIDGRADQWALACILYEGLTGEPPFVRQTPLATIVATLMADPTPLRERASDVPRGLADVIERALNRAKDGRFPSMAAFAAALEDADLSQSSAPVATRPSSMRPGERRVVALLFAEGVRDSEALEAAVGAGRGAFHRIAGDRALAVFGDATWEGDEVGRAASVALAARDAADFVSVATGWATSTGPGFTGDALDAAERCANAHLGGIGLDSAAARHLLDSHTVEKIADGLFELRAGAAGAPGGTALAAPLLGRDAELAQLAQSAGAVADERRSAVTLIEGPLGIGKARLMDEARRLASSRAAGLKVLVAGGRATNRNADLSLIRHLVSALLGPDVASTSPRAALRRAVGASLGKGPVAAAHAEALAELLAGAAGVDSSVGNDIAWSRDRSRLAFLEWLCAVADQQPVLLCVPDLHWVDEASLELLEDLVDAASNRPLWLVATVRPELVPEGPSPFAGADPQRVVPRGLTRRDTAALAHWVSGGELDDGLLARLHERSAGNPYFIIQSVRALAEQSARGGVDAALPLPATVEAAVQSRLDQLPAVTRAVCLDLSVFERAFTVAEADAVAATETAMHIERLARRDLLTTRGRRARATHRLSPLVREVAYLSLAEHARPDRHRRAAAYLAKTGDADHEERARHHELGGEAVLAAQGYASAARVAIRRGDAQTALRTAERALELGVPESDAFGLSVLRVDAYRFIGDREAHGRALSDALAVARDDAERARALSDLAVWRWRGGALAAAAEDADAAVAAARRSADPEALVLARGRQFLVLSRTDRADEAEAALAEAVKLSEGQDRRLRAAVLSWRAHHLALEGGLSSRLSAYVELVELYRELGDVRRMAGAQANLADVYNRLGAYAAAAEALEGAIADCRRVGHRTMEGYSSANLAYARFMAGDGEAALRHLDAAEAIASATSETRLRLLSGVYRAAALLRLGRDAEAATTAENVYDEASDHRATHDLAMNALAVAAEAHRVLGRLALALDRSARAMSLAGELGAVEEGEAEVFLARVNALGEAGHVEEAEQLKERAGARLHQIAAGIDDEELRATFLAGPTASRLLG